MSIVCRGGGIPPLHAQTAKTKPFLLLLFRTRNEAEIYKSSLVPRIPRSGMRTLKLCRCGQLGIFSHVRSGKGRENGARAYPQLRTGKRAKVVGNLLHVST